MTKEKLDPLFTGWRTICFISLIDSLWQKNKVKIDDYLSSMVKQVSNWTPLSLQPCYKPNIYRWHRREKRSYDNFGTGLSYYNSGGNRSYSRNSGRRDRSPFRDRPYYRENFRQREINRIITHITMIRTEVMIEDEMTIGIKTWTIDKEGNQV